MPIISQEAVDQVNYLLTQGLPSNASTIALPSAPSALGQRDVYVTLSPEDPRTPQHVRLFRIRTADAPQDYQAQNSSSTVRASRVVADYVDVVLTGDLDLSKIPRRDWKLSGSGAPFYIPVSQAGSIPAKAVRPLKAEKAVAFVSQVEQFAPTTSRADRLADRALGDLPKLTREGAQPKSFSLIDEITAAIQGISDNDFEILVRRSQAFKLRGDTAKTKADLLDLLNKVHSRYHDIDTYLSVQTRSKVENFLNEFAGVSDEDTRKILRTLLKDSRRVRTLNAMRARTLDLLSEEKPALHGGPTYRITNVEVLDASHTANEAFSEFEVFQRTLVKHGLLDVPVLGTGQADPTYEIPTPGLYRSNARIRALNTGIPATLGDFRGSVAYGPDSGRGRSGTLNVLHEVHVTQGALEDFREYSAQQGWRGHVYLGTQSMWDETAEEFLDADVDEGLSDASHLRAWFGAKGGFPEERRAERIAKRAASAEAADRREGVVPETSGRQSQEALVRQIEGKKLGGLEFETRGGVVRFPEGWKPSLRNVSGGWQVALPYATVSPSEVTGFMDEKGKPYTIEEMMEKLRTSPIDEAAANFMALNDRSPSASNLKPLREGRIALPRKLVAGVPAFGDAKSRHVIAHVDVLLAQTGLITDDKGRLYFEHMEHLLRQAHVRNDAGDLHRDLLSNDERAWQALKENRSTKDYERLRRLHGMGELKASDIGSRSQLWANSATYRAQIAHREDAAARELREYVAGYLERVGLGPEFDPRHLASVGKYRAGSAMAQVYDIGQGKAVESPGIASTDELAAQVTPEVTAVGTHKALDEENFSDVYQFVEDLKRGLPAARKGLASALREKDPARMYGGIFRAASNYRADTEEEVRRRAGVFDVNLSDAKHEDDEGNVLSVGDSLAEREEGHALATVRDLMEDALLPPERRRADWTQGAKPSYRTSETNDEMRTRSEQVAKILNRREALGAELTEKRRLARESRDPEARKALLADVKDLVRRLRTEAVNVRKRLYGFALDEQNQLFTPQPEQIDAALTGRRPLHFFGQNAADVAHVFGDSPMTREELTDFAQAQHLKLSQDIGGLEPAAFVNLHEESDGARLQRLREHTAQNGGRPALWHEQGLLHSRLGELKKAVASFARAEEESAGMPGHRLYVHDLGVAQNLLYRSQVDAGHKNLGINPARATFRANSEPVSDQFSPLAGAHAEARAGYHDTYEAWALDNGLATRDAKTREVTLHTRVLTIAERKAYRELVVAGVFRHTGFNHDGSTKGALGAAETAEDVNAVRAMSSLPPNKSLSAEDYRPVDMFAGLSKEQKKENAELFRKRFVGEFGVQQDVAHVIGSRGFVLMGDRRARLTPGKVDDSRGAVENRPGTLRVGRRALYLHPEASYSKYAGVSTVNAFLGRSTEDKAPRGAASARVTGA